MEALSPEPVAHLSQNLLVPILLQTAETYPTCRLERGAHVQHVVETAEHVTIHYNQQGKEASLAADYVIACNARPLYMDVCSALTVGVVLCFRDAMCFACKC